MPPAGILAKIVSTGDRRNRHICNPGLFFERISNLAEKLEGAAYLVMHPMKPVGEPLAVSLLFCTRNRAEQLKPCLDHVARLQTSHSWELIVVDNGSTDGNGQVLSQFKSEASFPMTVLYEGRPGKSRGLNQALPLLRGSIVALIDDDCYVAPDYIDRILEIFEDPRIGFAGGRVELFDPTDIPLTIQTSTEPAYLPPYSYVEPGWILGANMMFRRDVLLSVGGFDVDFGPGTPWYGDDPDVQARAGFAGWWALYAPTVSVAHHHRRKAAAAGPLNRTYSIGTGAYLAKHAISPKTGPIYFRMTARRWYWWVRQALRGGNGLTVLGWEAKGAAGYLALRARRKLSGCAAER